MGLKNRVKEHRARMDVNQSQLGKLAGVSRQTISLIERGDYSPSVALALNTFVGQNYGAGRMDRARKGVWQALWMTLSVTAVLCVAIVLGARPLNRLFTADEEVLSYGARFISIISPFYLACCFNQIYAGALRGAGDAKTPMYVMLFSFVLFRQAYLFINRQLGNSFLGVTLAYPMGWVVCSVLMVLFYQR